MTKEDFNRHFNGNVEIIRCESESLGLLRLEKEYLGTVLFTTDLSEVMMPVPSKYQQEASIELYFLLPDYWTLDGSNPMFRWAVETLLRTKTYLKAGRWAISGHTFHIPALPDGKMKDAGFEALLLMDPILLQNVLVPITWGEKEIFFKALCPIFKKEKEVKEARGMEKFMERYVAIGNNEKVDEFRISSIKNSVLFWR